MTISTLLVHIQLHFNHNPQIFWAKLPLSPSVPSLYWFTVLLCLRCTTLHFVFNFMKTLMAHSLSLSRSHGIYALPYIIVSHSHQFSVICKYMSPSKSLGIEKYGLQNQPLAYCTQLPAGCHAIGNGPADFQPIKQIIHPAHTSFNF